MKWKFEKNFTEKGYRMHYEKLKLYSEMKGWVCQYHIELTGVEPKIWRRVQVPSDYNFWDLHVALNDAMGWLDYHQHYFAIKGKGKRQEVHIGIPDFDRNEELQEVYPGWEIWMLAYFNALGVEGTYFYDYGDGWEHRVKLEGYMFRDRNINYPICVEGRRACPPEDCGGVDGYYNVLRTLADPEDEDNEDMRTWVGEEWDPECFDPANVHFDHPYKRWKNAFLIG